MNINEVLDKITKEKLLNLLQEAWKLGFGFGFYGSHISPEADEELKVEMNKDIQSLFKNPKEHKIVPVVAGAGVREALTEAVECLSAWSQRAGVIDRDNEYPLLSFGAFLSAQKTDIDRTLKHIHDILVSTESETINRLHARKDA